MSEGEGGYQGPAGTALSPVNTSSHIQKKIPEPRPKKTEPEPKKEITYSDFDAPEETAPQKTPHPLLCKNTAALEYWLHQMELRPEKFVRRAVRFIEEELEKRERSKILVALSGGVDSAVTAALCARTKFKDSTLAVTVNDDTYFRPEDLEDAQEISKKLGLEHRILDASEYYRLITEDQPTLAHHWVMGIRGVMIKALAEKESRVVVGASNKSERYAGLFCYNLMLGEIFPLDDIYKTQVYQLAKELGLPEKIATKPSHSGMRGDEDDEKVTLGMSFREFDVICYLLTQKKFYWPKRITKALGLPLQRAYYPEDGNEPISVPLVETIASNLKRYKVMMEFPWLRNE